MENNVVGISKNAHNLQQGQPQVQWDGLVEEHQKAHPQHRLMHQTSVREDLW
jgi:hypothetical protein